MSIDQQKPTPKQQPADGHAVWYFVGATFLFAGSAMGFGGDQEFFGISMRILFGILGAIVFAAGVWSLRRATLANRRTRAAAPDPEGTPAPAHPEQPPAG
ncbi:hypothetical protein ACEXQD_13190 [Herbiconiux sp. P15]|uniref:hypothetical protein n=1 Tax=Herbiconiux liukaitaii TaxID=3342799 RepID=UPI0035B95205